MAQADGNDGTGLQAGSTASDSAYLVSRCFSGAGTLSLVCIRNGYGW
ncbi:hypothetical protein ABZ890_27530 [Streptomyces sp. NPDC046984]